MITAQDKAILHRLWSGWVWSYRARLGLIFALMVVVALSGGAYPALIAHVFDVLALLESGGGGDAVTAQTRPSWLTLPSDLYIALPLLIITIASIKAIAMYFQVLSVNALALRVTTNIQKDMARHLIDADLAFISAEPVGVFISRIMNDLNLVREGLVRLSNNLVRDVLSVLVMVGMMFWFDWLLSLLVLAIYPLALRPIVRIGIHQRKASGDLQSHLEEVTSLLGEILHGVRLVKAYQREEAEKQRAGHAFDMLYKRLMILLAGRARIDPILEILGGIAIAGVVGVAAWRVAAGQMQIGDVVGFITALLMLVQPVRALGTLNAVLQEGLAAATRIFALLDSQNQVQDRVDAKNLTVTKGHIRFDKVSFSYGQTPILHQISFEVQPGQKVALVGPSGGGKSTIINLLPRFYNVEERGEQEGSITIDGQNIRHVTQKSLRQHIALVSQETILFNDTLKANILFGRAEASDQEVIKAAQLAAADEFITKIKGGYDGQAGASGHLLSGGQKQRIAIARALLRDAPILLLDEATSALDAQAETLIQHALDRLATGRTTLIVAHRLANIADADMILVIDKGRIIEQGTHSQLRRKKGLYAQLWALQGGA